MSVRHHCIGAICMSNVDCCTFGKKNHFSGLSKGLYSTATVILRLQIQIFEIEKMGENIFYIPSKEISLSVMLVFLMSRNELIYFKFSHLK